MTNVPQECKSQGWLLPFLGPQGFHVVEQEGNKLSNKGERCQGMEVGKNSWLEWARGYLQNGCV